MLRPQRFDRLLYVPLPDLESREQILLTATRKLKLDPTIDLKKIAAR